MISTVCPEQRASLSLAFCCVTEVLHMGRKSPYFSLLLLIIVIIPNKMHNHTLVVPCTVSGMLCRSWSQNMNKAERSNSVLQPPASPMNKHTDTSLNMPKGSYHIQLSNGCWYIIQVLCSHSDTLTSQNKSLICLNELDVHGFCAGIYKDEFPYYKKNLSLFFQTDLYGVWVWVCICHPLKGVSLRDSSPRTDTLWPVATHLCCIFPQISFNKCFLLIKNKLGSHPKSCYLKKKQSCITGNLGNCSLVWNGCSAVPSKFLFNHPQLSCITLVIKIDGICGKSTLHMFSPHQICQDTVIALRKWERNIFD